MLEDKKCECCGEIHNGDYGSGRFCTSKCAKSFSTKSKRKEINEKVSKKLTGQESKLKGIAKSDNSDLNFRINEERNCLICNNKYIALYKNSKYCSKECNYKKIITDETRTKISKISKKRCSTIEERIRMKEIGRKGGFGKKGYTEKGLYYTSTLEKKCFEYLENKKILFDTFKNLPNDSRETDIYLINYDIWIELDGINREKRKKYLGKNYDRWINKINYYYTCKLFLKIIYTYDEFILFIEELK